MSNELHSQERQMSALRDVSHELRSRLNRLDERFRDTSEDSYATRNDLRDDMRQVNQFIRRVERVIPGGSLNLTEQIVDYGYDAEQAACDQMCGLEYVSDFDRAKSVYESVIFEMQSLIEKLEQAGIRVETGVTAIYPPDHSDRFYEIAEEIRAEGLLDARHSPEKVLHRIVREAKEDRSELTAEFRAAIVDSQLARLLITGNSCDWCGRDIYAVDDHKMIDRQRMCNPCHEEMEL